MHDRLSAGLGFAKEIGALLSRALAPVSPHGSARCGALLGVGELAREGCAILR